MDSSQGFSSFRQVGLNFAVGAAPREVPQLSHVPSLPCSSAVFLTGSDRIPIYGMSSLRIIIQSTPSGEQYLPVAHTCYNLLDLPKYSSKEILSARLVQAIDHYEGFSLA